jgi:hypothetical protein
MVNAGCKPQYQWVDTKSIAPGYCEPICIEYPGGVDGSYWSGYPNWARGLYLVRLAQLPNLLNIRYLDDFDTGHHDLSAQQSQHKN